MSQLTDYTSLILNNIIPTLVAISTFLGILLNYSKKSDFDLIFEDKNIKFLTKLTKSILIILVLYIILQINAIIIYYPIQELTIFEKFKDWNFANVLDLITAILLLCYIIYTIIVLLLKKLFTWIKSLDWVKKLYRNFKNYIYNLLNPKVLNFISSFKKIIILIRKLFNFIHKVLWYILYVSIYILGVYVQSIYFSSIKAELPKVSLTDNEFITFIVHPMFLIIALFAIFFFHGYKKGDFRKNNHYAMRFIEFDELNQPGIELIHLYTKNKTQWIFVKKENLVDQKYIYLFEKDKEKWYEYKRITHSS
ncbi:hypothetical protein COM98_29070 [Bacillus cereus]|uniref:hypothetical protein n=1 Tax=Bacillus cereus TaxID=1396 RepID=UPI000BED564B|nr:hypothetical protein [Bacillus cereus]PEC01485.1 hypothetical protein COM98_29070 [Bacillus cereus]